MLNVGDKAPEFTLPNQEGVPVSLSDFGGTQVVVWFFPKANTPGWSIEGQGFRDEFKNFTEQNIEIIGVSADPIAKQKKFCDKYDFPFNMLCDETHSMLESYGVWGLKNFMGREYMGISRVTYIIDSNGVISDVYKKVQIKTHAQDILSSL